MPITACFICMTFLAVILLILILPISLILLGHGRRRIAMILLSLPISMIVLSPLFTVLVLVATWQYDVRMPRNPVRLFEDTFDFHLTPGIEVLEGYCRSGLDSETRAMRFRAPPDAVERMCRGRFAPRDRETFVQAYGGEWNDLPDHVLSWFLPAVEQAGHFYIAKPFNQSVAGADKSWKPRFLCLTGVSLRNNSTEMNPRGVILET